VAARDVTRRAARAAGWKLARRALKPVPFIGTALVLGTAGYALRRKGAWRGAAHVGLDLIPIVGTAKAVVELFTGDLLPDKKQ
jgi:hypothetical protein